MSDKPNGEKPQVATAHTRLEALKHMRAFLTAASLMIDAPLLREAAIKQMRHDLHVLGVTSDELDEAGFK